MAQAQEVLKTLLSGKAYDLDQSPAPIERGDKEIDRSILPYISDPLAWKNYENRMLYDAEVELRKFIVQQREIPKWRNTVAPRRYTFKMLFEILFHREFDPHTDMKSNYMLKKLFAYYSTKITNSYTDSNCGVGEKGYHKSLKGYHLSSKDPTEKRPYSLRLRIEWLAERGKVPSAANMKLCKDNLEPGHARSKKTEENIERRRKAARERYRIYQQNRKRAIEEENDKRQASGADA